MAQEKYLMDGTPVEVLSRQRNEAGLMEAKIRPVDKEAFESGVNPWILECYLLSEQPLKEPDSDGKGAP